MESDRVFLGLGSNLGDGPDNLRQAVRHLKIKLSVEFRLSPVYRSEPVGVLDQPWFYNMALSFPAGNESPRELLKIVKDIESVMGRIPTVRYGPRIIDIDILLYRNWVFESCHLILPHPRIEERSFVLQPLIDLEPTFIHPRLQESVSRIFQKRRETLTRCEKLLSQSIDLN